MPDFNPACMLSLGLKLAKTKKDLLAQAEQALIRGSRSEAKKRYQRFLAKKEPHPGRRAALFTYGNLLVEDGQVEQGIELLEQSLKEKEFIEGRLELGSAYLGLKDHERAFASFEKALAMDSGSDSALYGLACCAMELHGPSQALSFIDRALRINPSAQYFDFAAMAHFMLGRRDVALKYQRQAHMLEGSFHSLSNLADMQKKLGLFTEALDTAGLMLQAQPESVEAHQLASFLHLICGDYEKGWKEFDWRRKLNGYFRIYSRPYWDGTQDLSGKTLFLYGEQGFGDIIQFMRFVPVLKTRHNNLKIILELSPPLASLFSGLGVDEIRIRPLDQKWNVDVREDFDFHCSVLSLPLHLGSTLDSIPFSQGYLHADREKKKAWKEKTGEGFNVGIVWHGQAEGRTKVDNRRNIPLRQFFPLLDVKGARFFSLQKGEASSQIKGEGLEERIEDFTEGFCDFSDTAAFISNLDLVIGVDTAVIHLAGALGKPVWLLNRMDGCWRWMHERGDSPWYFSMRIFRQKSWLGWEPVFEKAAAALQDYVKT
jgi:tetratricopeptide (TPR) repeat protein